MTDLEFVQRCVNGDRLAWDEFIKRYSRLVYSYIYSVFKVKGYFSAPQDAVAELFQEIFLSLIKDNYRRLRSFKARNGCSLASWLRQVSINATINYLRGIKPVISLEAKDGLKESIVAESVSAVEECAQDEKVSLLKECIGRLGTGEQYFLSLVLDSGLVISQLQDVFRSSRQAIEMRKSRLVEKLRECFRRKGFIIGHQEGRKMASLP